MESRFPDLLGDIKQFRSRNYKKHYLLEATNPPFVGLAATLKLPMPRLAKFSLNYVHLDRSPITEVF